MLRAPASVRRHIHDVRATPGSGKSHNPPCFCGSGRKLKQCCLRSLRQVRQWKLPGGPCRWRFWEAHGPGMATFASEVARASLQRRPPLDRPRYARRAEVIDQDPVTLLEVIDRVPGDLYDWVFEQTLAAVRSRLRPSDERAAPVAFTRAPVVPAWAALTIPGPGTDR